LIKFYEAKGRAVENPLSSVVKFAELSLQPFLFADAGSPQNSGEESNPNISTMWIRNG
jgi:hypothetical protein